MVLESIRLEVARVGTEDATVIEVFGEQHQSNAYMVRLKNHETSNVESRSAKLMKLDGVKGIVQNTTSKKQHARRAEVSGIAAE